MYCLDDYQYQLPKELIAQVPVQRRDDSRLLVLNRATGSMGHRKVAGLEHYLTAGDVVVVNDTRVVPARLVGKKASGGKVELLVLHPTTDQKFYRCLVKSSKGVQEGAILLFENGLRARVCEQVVEGQSRVEFIDDRPLLEILECTGCVPLPPYIRRNGGPVKVDDGRDYQTIYATKPGAVAAPTAGLHFTEDLLNRLKKKGVILAPLTLHVGFGTFQPVRVSDIRQHRLQEEFFEIPTETAQAVNRAKENGNRVVAVGTTTVRALEFAASNGQVRPGSGWCDLLIYPGYRFQIIDRLLTNFHLPGSSLVMLVSAWAGRDLLLKAYAVAIRMRYRFYSYGDAMFIE
ncbi:MAG: tRNA preQ1(34) S-adenosylmethionine ribosyltransferase-isomerase QueA [Syntrophobacteria bacterium]|jgi:S-adenosylmethionine:tRNA ribosyltransferase-isomerase